MIPLVLVVGVSLFSVFYQQRDFHSIRSLSDWTERRTSRRSIVGSNEFMYEYLSQEEIDRYFYFDESVLDNDDGSLTTVPPMWTCRSDQTRFLHSAGKKMIFLHVSRTGGSTIRAVLKGYSHFCHKSIATVSHCVDLGYEYLHGKEPWRNGRDSSKQFQLCHLAFASDRAGNSIQMHVDADKKTIFQERLFEVVSTNFLQANDIDIVTGFLPLGSDAFWFINQENMNNNSYQHHHLKKHLKHADTQYYIMLRNPLDLLISRLLFVNRFQNVSTVDEAIVLVNDTVTHEYLEKGLYFEKFSNHLITPQQRAWANQERIMWTTERRVNLTKSNLIHNRVIVGILERLSESLDMLQHVLDGNYEIQGLFDYFSTATATAAATTTESKIAIHSNTSSPRKFVPASNPLTKSVIKHIQESMPKLSMQLQEYLKYENQIYQWGMKIHERQLASILEMRRVRKKYSDSNK